MDNNSKKQLKKLLFQYVIDDTNCINCRHYENDNFKVCDKCIDFEKFVPSSTLTKELNELVNNVSKIFDESKVTNKINNKNENIK